MPEQPKLLLQVDVNAAEKDPLLTYAGFVGAHGSVRGDQERIMSLRSQCGHERVVVHATAAVHARGAGSDVSDLHGPIPGAFQAFTSRGGSGRNQLTRKP